MTKLNLRELKDRGTLLVTSNARPDEEPIENALDAPPPIIYFTVGEKQYEYKLVQPEDDRK